MLRDFFRDKSTAQRVMIGAIVLNALSQFMLYSDAYAGPSIGTDYDGLLYYMFPNNLGRHSGWELHWHAAPILIVLAFCYLRDDVVDSPLFARFGWALSVLLLLAATIPMSLEDWGFGSLWGLVSVVAAIVAAVMHRRQSKRAAGIPPAAPKS